MFCKAIFSSNIGTRLKLGGGFYEEEWCLAILQEYLMNWKQLNRWGFGFVLASCVAGSVGAMHRDDQSIHSRSSEMPDLSDDEIQDLVVKELEDCLIGATGYEATMQALDTVRVFVNAQKEELSQPVDQTGTFFSASCYNQRKGGIEKRKIRSTNTVELERVRTKNEARIRYCNALLKRVAAERTRCFKDYIAVQAARGEEELALAEKTHKQCFAKVMSFQATVWALDAALENFGHYIKILKDIQGALGRQSPMGPEGEVWRAEQQAAVACSLGSVEAIAESIKEARGLVTSGDYHPDILVDRVPLMSLVLDNKWQLLTSGLLTATMVCVAGVPLGLLWLPAAMGGVIGGSIGAVEAWRHGATPMGALKRGFVGALSGSMVAAGSAAVVSPVMASAPVPTEVVNSVKLFAGGATASALRDVGSNKAWRSRVKSAAFAGATGAVIGGVFDLVAWWARVEQTAAQLAFGKVEGARAERLAALQNDFDGLNKEIRKGQEALEAATASRNGVQKALNACDTTAETCFASGTNQPKGSLALALQHCRTVTPAENAQQFIENCSATARRLHPCETQLEECLAHQATILTLENAESAVTAASKHLDALKAQMPALEARIAALGEGAEGFCADELAQCNAKVGQADIESCVQNNQGSTSECAGKAAEPCSTTHETCVDVVKRAANPSAPEKVSEFFDSAVGRLLPVPAQGNLLENAVNVASQSATDATAAVKGYDWASWVPSMPEWLRVPDWVRLPSMSWPSFLGGVADDAAGAAGSGN